MDKSYQSAASTTDNMLCCSKWEIVKKGFVGNLGSKRLLGMRKNIINIAKTMNMLVTNSKIGACII